MNYNSKITISFIIALTSLFAATSSGLPTMPAFAQSGGDDDDDATGTSNYKEFVKCLAQSEGNKGYASESEIRDCFRPVYDPESSTSDSPVTSDGPNDASAGDGGSGIGSSSADNVNSDSTDRSDSENNGNNSAATEAEN